MPPDVARYIARHRLYAADTPTARVKYVRAHGPRRRRARARSRSSRPNCRTSFAPPRRRRPVTPSSSICARGRVHGFLRDLPDKTPARRKPSSTGIEEALRKTWQRKPSHVEGQDGLTGCCWTILRFHRPRVHAGDARVLCARTPLGQRGTDRKCQTTTRPPDRGRSAGLRRVYRTRRHGRAHGRTRAHAHAHARCARHLPTAEGTTPGSLIDVSDVRRASTPPSRSFARSHAGSRSRSRTPRPRSVARRLRLLGIIVTQRIRNALAAAAHALSRAARALDARHLQSTTKYRTHLRRGRTDRSPFNRARAARQGGRTHRAASAPAHDRHSTNRARRGRPRTARQRGCAHRPAARAGVRGVRAPGWTGPRAAVFAPPAGRRSLFSRSPLCARCGDALASLRVDR